MSCMLLTFCPVIKSHTETTRCEHLDLVGLAHGGKESGLPFPFTRIIEKNYYC